MPIPRLNRLGRTVVPILAVLAVSGCAAVASAPSAPAAAVASDEVNVAGSTDDAGTIQTVALGAATSSAFAGLSFDLVASDRTFSESHFDADAGEAFEIRFENRDPFKIAVYISQGATRPTEYTEQELAGVSAFRGDYITGPAAVTYHVAALPPGIYSFFCPVHQAMVGTITVH